MKTILVLTITALTLTVGCSTTSRISDDALLLNDSSTLIPPGNITLSQAKNDADTLIYALQSGYGGRKFIPGNELETQIIELKKIASSAPSSQSTWNFCTTIASVLFKIPDNHLSARLQGSDCSQEHNALFSDGKVGNNLLTDKKLPWAINYKKARRLQIPVVSITSFPYHEDAVWKGFLDQVTELRKKAPAIIIDMRGNGGGDDTIGRKMAAILYGQEPPRSYEAIIKSQTPATMALAVNNFQLKILRLRKNGEQIPEFLSERISAKKRMYNDAKNGLLPPEDGRRSQEMGHLTRF